MLLTIYESAYAFATIYKESISDVLVQIGLTVSSSNSCMLIAKNTYPQKVKLIDDKKKALANISSKTVQMSDSNVTILNNAYEASRRAYEFRLNLELSVLNSQLKSIEIEMAKIKLMTAEEFTAKYGQ
jgi:hypothetical protein